MAVTLCKQMLENSDRLPSEMIEQLAEPHPLLEQLGSMEGLVTLTAATNSLEREAVDSFESLVRFLEIYQSRILLPLELPAIYRAYQHACRGETRELIAVDVEIGKLPILKEFVSASHRVGYAQLSRLKPLRYERLVQRYLQAVEQNQAKAWHTLVYGVTLALYSIPVRQGLMHYARQTLSGFIHSATRPLQLSEVKSRETLDHLCADLRPRLEALIASDKITSMELK
jgi:urease accessory protein UreF